MSGWIKLHRSLIDWQYWDDHNTTRLLIFLLVIVNHEQKKWLGIIIEPGQIVTSFEKLSFKTGMSISQIRRSIKLLENDNQITRKTTNKFQLITLVKWDELQIETPLNDKQNNKKQQSNNNQTTTTKECKEIKEIKNNINNIESRKIAFRDTIAPFLNIYGKTMLNEFFAYWIEPNKSNTKMRFELERTWSTELRLKKWASNDKNFNFKTEKPKNYNPRA